MNTTTNTNEGRQAMPGLRDARLAAGLTQLQLAVEADVALGTVRNAEAGMRVTVRVRERLERELGRQLPQAA